MKFTDFGILITAYENVEQTLQNILHIRKNFTSINKCQIVVISTTEKQSVKEAFTNLLYREGLQPLIVKVLDNVPGNPGCNWERPEWETAINWRHRYLGGRIFKSLSVGWNLLYDLDIEIVYHLHSDSFIKPQYEPQLLNEIYDLQHDFMGIWDICIEDTGNLNHIHPEGMNLNIQKCRENNILDIFDCFNCSYKTWNPGSIEAVIGTFVNYCLCGRSVKIDEECSQLYYQEFVVRTKRSYHGDFEHIINLGGVQPDANHIAQS